MQIKSLEIKNYKLFSEALFDFETKPNQNVSLVLGGNGSGKTILIEALNWCLYHKTDDYSVIFPMANELNFPITVSVETIITENNKQYQIKTSQVFYSRDNYDDIKTEILITENDGKSTPITNDITENIINSIIPQYIGNYSFCNWEKFHNLSQNTSQILTDYISDLKNDNLFTISLSQFLDKLNLYINNQFQNMTKKHFLQLYIDDKFKLYIQNKNDSNSNEYFGNTEVSVLSSLAVVSALVKIYEDLKNTSCCFVIDSPFSYLDDECLVRVSNTLVSSFEQIIILSNSDKTYLNQSLIPTESYYKPTQTETDNLINCVINQYLLKSPCLNHTNCEVVET